jgi:hypothetical protein
MERDPQPIPAAPQLLRYMARPQLVPATTLAHQRPRLEFIFGSGRNLLYQFSTESLRASKIYTYRTGTRTGGTGPVLEKTYFVDN